jgi:hypothetical protein
MILLGGHETCRLTYVQFFSYITMKESDFYVKLSHGEVTISSYRQNDAKGFVFDDGGISVTIIQSRALRKTLGDEPFFISVDTTI